MIHIAQRLQWRGLQWHGLHWRLHSHRGWIALVKTWWRRMQDRQALATMDDRSLRDIGITRCDALHEADKPFWRA
jgi:uncharacterized protein YjiS (DUF1127 family)